MESVEHLGQYVFEMTNAKVQQLRAEKGLPEAQLQAVKEILPDDETQGDQYYNREAEEYQDEMIDGPVADAAEDNLDPEH